MINNTENNTSKISEDSEYLKRDEPEYNQENTGEGDLSEDLQNEPAKDEPANGPAVSEEPTAENVEDRAPLNVEQQEPDIKAEAAPGSLIDENILEKVAG